MKYKSINLTELFSAGEDIDESSLLINVEKPWNINLIVNDKKKLLFNYVISIANGNTCKHIFEKCVIITADRKVQYEVYSKPVNISDYPSLPNFLDDIKNIPEILKIFQRMLICRGIGKLEDISSDSRIQEVISKSTENFYSGHVLRDKNCSLLYSKSVRCDSCQKLRNLLAQKERRFKKIDALEGPQYSTEGILNHKLRLLRQKLSRQRRLKNRLKCRLQLLKDNINKQQNQCADVDEDFLDNKCYSFQIEDKQKLLLKEIILAAKAKTSKGRRYSNAWMTQCIMMNDESPTYYEYLRKNGILPLPCQKTVRDYFNLINNQSKEVETEENQS